MSITPEVTALYSAHRFFFQEAESDHEVMRLSTPYFSARDVEGLIDTLSSWPYLVDCSGQQNETWEE